MRTAGIVVLVVGLVVGVLAAMIPFSTTVFGGVQGDCGAPLFRVLSNQQVEEQGLQNIIDKCEEEARPRLLVAAGAVVLGVSVGGGLIAAGTARARRNGPDGGQTSSYNVGARPGP